MSSFLFLLLMLLVVAVILDLLILRKIRSPQRLRSEQDVYIFGSYSPALTWLRALFAGWRAGQWQPPPLHVEWSQVKTNRSLRSELLTDLEFLLIVFWALLITLPYLNMDPNVLPAGGEYLSAIQTHHLWTRFQECGACAFWNGSVRGGAPAFSDLHGSMLHPLVALTSLGWGVVNGSKLALSAAFLVAGLAQWWLGRVLELGRLARLWAALMAVAGGHLAGRMELGAFGVVLSLAFGSLVFPALIQLTRRNRRRDAVWLGAAMGLTILAGQGYMQVGLVVTLFATPLLIPWKTVQFGRLAANLGLAIILAVLLAAPFLLPFIHFMPEFTKTLDPQFRTAQPLEYVPLNLVIRDPDFYRNTTLAKTPYASLHTIYIGWTAVILAVFGIFKCRTPQERRAANFLFAAALLVMWVAGAQPLRWLAANIPFRYLSEFISGIRNPAQIAAMAIPPILGLASIGLDWLWTNPGWPALQVKSPPSSSKPSFSLRILILIPLLLSLQRASEYSQDWIFTTQHDPAVDEIIQALSTPDLQWVNTPFGRHSFVEPAVRAGLKLADGVQTWGWKERQNPLALLEANSAGPPPEMTLLTNAGGIPIYQAETGREYAQVQHGDDSPPDLCQAYGLGGNLDVFCQTKTAGTLIVQENQWDGWKAWLNAEALPLLPGRWLAIELPAGENTILFRYRPWDAPLGILLSFLGICLAVWILVKSRNAPQTAVDDEQTTPAEPLATDEAGSSPMKE